MGQKNGFGFVFFWAETVAISCELKSCFFFSCFKFVELFIKMTPWNYQNLLIAEEKIFFGKGFVLTEISCFTVIMY